MWGGILSALESKSLTAAESRAGKATQTLKQLRTRWGAKEDWKQPPVLVLVEGMTREVWRRVDDGLKGDGTLYELEDRP